MIGLIGIKKNTPIEIREKFVIKPKKHKEYTYKLREDIEEVVLLSTCNRTEIYVNTVLNEEELLEKIFDVFNWDDECKKYVFITKDHNVYRHLFEVCSGFHSKILGEDQILGQIKDAYEDSLEIKAVSKELQRLFQEAVTCGKKFRKEAKLFEIPVSSASIAVNEAIKHGSTKFMVFGYGEIGKLVVKYLLSHRVELIYLVVRNTQIKDELKDERIKVIEFSQKNNFINQVHCLIGCTSAPHPIVKKVDIDESGDKLIIYDLAVPRDIEKEVASLDRTEVYNIDDISFINDENKKLRKERMEEKKYILNNYLDEYERWLSIRKIVPNIIKLKDLGYETYSKRVETFNNKNKSSNERDILLAEKLIKSTSDYYINRAIEVLKEETLKGCDEECIKILERIFVMKK